MQLLPLVSAQAVHRKCTRPFPLESSLATRDYPNPAAGVKLSAAGVACPAAGKEHPAPGERLTIAGMTYPVVGDVHTIMTRVPDSMSGVACPVITQMHNVVDGTMHPLMMRVMCTLPEMRHSASGVMFNGNGTLYPVITRAVQTIWRD